MRGIPTDVQLRKVNVLDTKNVGVAIFRQGGAQDAARVSWVGGLLAGQTSGNKCTSCERLTDSGCHQKLSTKSFNTDSSMFTPSIGLQATIFATSFPTGPEWDYYDTPIGDQMVQGRMDVSDITIADWYGPYSCGGAMVGGYAIGNSANAPDAFHPHFFGRINIYAGELQPCVSLCWQALLMLGVAHPVCCCLRYTSRSRASIGSASPCTHSGAVGLTSGKKCAC